MKRATGITRRIDDLGRIIVPKTVRESLRIEEGDLLEIYIVDGGVLFKKVEEPCTFCGELTGENLLGKYVCKTCKENIKAAGK